jgi:hypothetical protein
MRKAIVEPVFGQINEYTADSYGSVFGTREIEKTEICRNIHH